MTLTDRIRALLHLRNQDDADLIREMWERSGALPKLTAEQRLVFRKKADNPGTILRIIQRLKRKENGDV
jgi:hypothetical protein